MKSEKCKMKIVQSASLAAVFTLHFSFAAFHFAFFRFLTGLPFHIEFRPTSTLLS